MVPQKGMISFKKNCKKKFLPTRMHSSRMRTVRCSGRLPSSGEGGCLLLGGVCSGGSAPRGGCLLLGGGVVCSRGCLLPWGCLLPGGGCLLQWGGVGSRGVCSWGVSASGGCLLLGRCLLWGGVYSRGVCSWGVSAPGGGIPACTEADTPTPLWTDTRL